MADGRSADCVDDKNGMCAFSKTSGIFRKSIDGGNRFIYNQMYLLRQVKKLNSTIFASVPTFEKEAKFLQIYDRPNFWIDVHFWQFLTGTVGGDPVL